MGPLLSLWTLGCDSTSGCHVCPAVPRGLGHIAATELVGSCQALSWHMGAQPLPLGEPYSSPKPVPRSVIWQPSQPRGCHLAKQVLETPAERIAAIILGSVTSLTNKRTPGPWVLGQGRASNPANVGEEDGQGQVGDTAREEPWLCTAAGLLLLGASVFPSVKQEGGLVFVFIEQIVYLTSTVWEDYFHI